MVSSLLSGVSTSVSAFKVRMAEGAGFLTGGSGFAAGAEAFVFLFLGGAEASGALLAAPLSF